MKSSMEDKKILVSLTSLSSTYDSNLPSGWRSKIEEIKKYNLKEIALFLTGLEAEERKKLYKNLENSPVENIPHVHLRTDMHPDELKYLVERYKTRVFNIHPLAEFPLIHDYSEYAERIYLENTVFIPTGEELEKFGGICLDFAHWEDRKLSGNMQYCADVEEKAKKYKIGCAHASAVNSEPVPTIIDPNVLEFDSHIMKNPKEFDYLKRYLEYLPEIVSIELENSIKEQLEAKKYIEAIINSEAKR